VLYFLSTLDLQIYCFFIEKMPKVLNYFRLIFFRQYIFLFQLNTYMGSHWRVGKIALFGKALVAGLACGALAMCAMWVGFPNCPEGQKRAGKTK